MYIEREREPYARIVLTEFPQKKPTHVAKMLRYGKREKRKRTTKNIIEPRGEMKI